ncbi:MT-A70-domain-containing protein [Globomyces pollinis-pini]|nr:MT-A70-domain-containing protein [Globomyces pollinis-pini]
MELFKNEVGWILRSDLKTLGKYQYNSGDYNLQHPYINQSEKKVKKLKSNHFNQFEPIHDQFKVFLNTCIETLIKESKVFPICFDTDVVKSNQLGILNFATFCELASMNFGMDPTISQMELRSNTELEFVDIFNTLLVNDALDVLEIKIMDRLFIIPSQCRFLISDFKTIPKWLEDQNEMYGLIVMDPPWFNTSAQRGSKYQGLDCYALFQLPIKKILNQDGYLVIWVSNNIKFHRFVLNKLFPAWNLECVGKWTWIKVTNSGLPVIDLNSEHRKPYEVFYIGRPTRVKSSIVTQSNFPMNKCIVSVPSQHHSQKPYLNDIFQEYIGKDCKKLELFARNLGSGWTSWGNETCLYNDKCFYTNSYEPIVDVEPE